MLHLEIWARDFETKKRAFRVQRATAEKESQKWLTALAAIEAALPASQAVLVLADREADFYDYLSAPRRAQTQLLVRAHQSRKVRVVGPEVTPDLVGAGSSVAAGAKSAAPAFSPAVGALPPATAPVAAPAAKRVRGAKRARRVTPPAPGCPLPAVLAAAPILGEQEVRVPTRPGQPARTAVLTVRWVALEVLVPADYRRRSDTPGKPVWVWAVDAREEQPPAGVTAIQWVLLTTLPLTSPEAVFQALVH